MTDNALLVLYTLCCGCNVPFGIYTITRENLSINKFNVSSEALRGRLCGGGTRQKPWNPLTTAQNSHHPEKNFSGQECLSCNAKEDMHNKIQERTLNIELTATSNSTKKSLAFKQVHFNTIIEPKIGNSCRTDISQL